ncbi:hypothetical protein FTX61_11660 [Nitriliruptoraceae bacterium ZYF776]|nr:hypothetical protein [Profundirhabdus halotolerans]
MNSTTATLLQARRMIAERDASAARQPEATPSLPTGLARARDLTRRHEALPEPAHDQRVELLRLDAGRRFKLSTASLAALEWEPATRLRVHSFASQLFIERQNASAGVLGGEAKLDKGGRLCLGPGHLVALGLGRDASEVQAVIDPVAQRVRLVDPRRLVALLDAVTPVDPYALQEAAR